LKAVVPENYMENLRKAIRDDPQHFRDERYFNTPTADDRYIWTDDYSNLFRVLKW